MSHFVILCSSCAKVRVPTVRRVPQLLRRRASPDAEDLNAAPSSVVDSREPAAPRPPADSTGPVAGGPARRREAGLVAAVALAGFAVARLFDLTLLLRASHGRHGHPVGYYLTVWDGGWYRRVAEQGYPTVLVHARNGYLRQNALAFFPGYPETVRGVQHVTGLSFAQAGSGLNLIFGAAAAVVIAFVLRPHVGAATAAVSSVFWSFLPVSPLLMMTYTEALFSLELAVFAWLLARRRYLWLALLMPVIGLSRAALPPLALVLLVHLAVRWREASSAGPERGRMRWRASGAVAGLLAALAVSFALWPAWVGHRTGRADGYAQVEQAWTKGRGTYQTWGRAFGLLFHGDVELPSHGLVAAVFLALLVVAVIVLFLPLSAELKALAPASMLFFLLGTMATTSFFRYMLPIFPFVVVPALVVRLRWWWPVRVVLVLAILAGLAVGQHWWIDHFVLPYPHGRTP